MMVGVKEGTESGTRQIVLENLTDIVTMVKAAHLHNNRCEPIINHVCVT